MTAGLLFIDLLVCIVLATFTIRDFKRSEQLKEQSANMVKLDERVRGCEDRISTLEMLEAKRTKREAELNATMEQFQKAQKIEQLWQEGLENIQAYDMDTARKAVSGRGGE